ncbi:MAG: ABC transporter permease [Desulfohalobiaceae bacterium]
MDLAFKDIGQNAGKFLATVFGVGLLLGIVLVMNGIYRGNIQDGIWLIENTQTDLWVVEKDTAGPFNEQSRMPKDSWKSLAAMPQVSQADPFISYQVERRIEGKRRRFTIIGYDVFGELGGPGRLVTGRSIRQAHYEMVVDAKLGLDLGQKLRLGRQEYTVVGLTKNAKDARGSPLVYLSLPDAQEILYQKDNRALELSRAKTENKLQGKGLSQGEMEKVLPLVTGESSADTINAILVRLSPEANIRQTAKKIES